MGIRFRSIKCLKKSITIAARPFFGRAVFIFGKKKMAFFQKKKLEKELTTNEIIGKLEQFCAFRDRCSQEVKQKFRDLRVPVADADEIMQLLENEGFVDDERFAKMYAQGKFRQSHWGRIRIRQELSMRQISAKLVQKAFEEIDEAEYAKTLADLLERRLPQYENEDDGFQKLANFGIRRGFEPGLVFDEIKRLKRAKKDFEN